MTSFTQKIMMTFVVMATLVACSKGNDSRTTARTGSGSGVSGNSVTTCSNSSQSSVGRVYDSAGATTNTFEQRVKGLLSALVDPQYFGTISGNSNNAQTGVSIEGRIRYDGNGNILLDQTNLKLIVTDSFVGTKDTSGATIQPYPINFSTAASGNINLATKTFNVMFKDNYGELTLTGVINGNTVSGSISFSNYTSYNNSTLASGTLGEYQISSCGLIN